MRSSNIRSINHAITDDRKGVCFLFGCGLGITCCCCNKFNWRNYFANDQIGLLDPPITHPPSTRRRLCRPPCLTINNRAGGWLTGWLVGWVAEWTGRLKAARFSIERFVFYFPYQWYRPTTTHHSKHSNSSDRQLLGEGNVERECGWLVPGIGGKCVIYVYKILITIPVFWGPFWSDEVNWLWARSISGGRPESGSNISVDLGP